jgi:hypothetical protein
MVAAIAGEPAACELATASTGPEPVPAATTVPPLTAATGGTTSDLGTNETPIRAKCSNKLAI